jgi:hypothetical protein
MRREALALALTLVSTAAWPQALTGSLGGAVRDEQGSVLVGATVTLVAKTGKTAIRTDEAGRYRYPALEPGVYELRVALDRFQGQRRADIRVTVASRQTIDFTLKLARDEKVEVVAEEAVVDVESPSTSTTISQDLLFNMPFTRFTAALPDVAPGVNSASAYGGADHVANALLIDGVGTRDPLYGTACSCVLNYNVVQEVQVQGLGVPAEYGGFTGAVFNTITKSGGNLYGGLFELRYSNDRLTSDNTGVLQAGDPTFEPFKEPKLFDGTAQLSGPVVKEKLFFFLNAQGKVADYGNAGLFIPESQDTQRYNTKINYQPSPQNHFMAMFQYDRDQSYDAFLVADPSPSQDLAVDFLFSEVIWNAQWRHVFDRRTFLEARYLGYSSTDEQTPKVLASGRRDGVTGLHSVSDGHLYRHEARRQQVNFSLSRFADSFLGKHDFKFGLEVERGQAQDFYGYVGGLFYYDYASAPYLAYSYSYDITVHNQRESVYVQDQWKPNSRISLELGLRYDRIRSSHPDLGTVYRSGGLAPRLGMAFDPRGDQRSVLKLTYGRYYEGPLGAYAAWAVPATRDYVVYDNTGPELVEISRQPAEALYRIDSGIGHPRADELTLGFEQALSQGMSLSVTGVLRRNGNVVGSTFPDARYSPVDITNNLTGAPLTVYRWENPEASQGLFTNADGLQYRDPEGGLLGTMDAFRRYRGLLIVLSRRFTGRWQAQASYVLSRSEGTVDNTANAHAGYTRQFQTPSTALVNTEGELLLSRRHEVKLMATYRIPKIELAFSAYFRSLSGVTYQAMQNVPASVSHSPVPSDPVLLEARGSRRLATQNILDLRADKVFQFGKHRVGPYLDVQNVFNADTVLGVTRLVVPDPEANAFETPLSVVAPRQMILGVRWSF